LELETIVADLQRILREKLNLHLDQPDQDLFASGLIDSLAFVELIAALEVEFRRPIDLLDVELDDFQNLQSIAQFIAARHAIGEKP
jgi:methoxymalonate biosynthesis acyl carrier protein